MSKSVSQRLLYSERYLYELRVSVGGVFAPPMWSRERAFIERRQRFPIGRRVQNRCGMLDSRCIYGSLAAPTAVQPFWKSSQGANDERSNYNSGGGSLHGRYTSVMGKSCGVPLHTFPHPSPLYFHRDPNFATYKVHNVIEKRLSAAMKR